MNVLKKLCIGWVIALASLSMVGCAREHGHGCGAGDELQFEGATYCVYKASIIEEGFSCPAHVANEYDFDGYKACGVPAEPPEDLEEEVYRVYKSDAGLGSGCTGTPPNCSQDIGAGCCGDVEMQSTCTSGTWTCPGTMIPLAECSGFGPSCLYGDGGVDDGGVTSTNMFHLEPVPIDPVSLRLNDDGTFEWIKDGCDFGNRSEGRYVLGETIIDLQPADGKTTFDWIDADTDQIVELTELRARFERTANAPEGVVYDRITVEFDTATQVWDLGGVCPVCGELGPSETVACDKFRGE